MNSSGHKFTSVNHENQRPICFIGFHKGGTVEERQHSTVTDAIICSFYRVYNKLGYGFLEKVYENAMIVDLAKIGLPTLTQLPIVVFYQETIVGEYFCDLLVDNKVIVEIKAARSLLTEHEAQLLNYLKATDIEVGLLLNFGPKPEVRRKVYSNKRKRMSQ